MIVWKTVSNDYVQMILNGKPLFERANEKWGGGNPTETNSS